MNIQEALLRLRRDFSGRSLEWYSAITLFLFGAALLAPGETFSRPWYSHLAAIGCEWTWGTGMVLAGLAQALAIHWCRGEGSYWCRTTASFISCVTWAFIALPLVCRIPVSAGAVPYLTLACAMGLVVARGRPS